MFQHKKLSIKIQETSNLKNKNLSSVEGKFKKLTNENWTPPDNHYSIETFIKAKRNEIQEKIKKKHDHRNIPA